MNATSSIYPQFHFAEVHLDTVRLTTRSTVGSYLSDLSLPVTASELYSRWQWNYLLYAFAAWAFTSLFWKFWWKAPTNVLILAYPTVLGRWFTALRMLFNSEAMMEEAYALADGKSFALPMFDRWIVCVTDHEMLSKLDNEPEMILSRELALHQLASTHEILGTLRTHVAFKNHKSEVLRVNGGVLKNKLRSSLPEKTEPIRNQIREAFILEVPEQNGEWNTVRVMPALLRIFTRVSLLSFFGPEMGKDPKVFNMTMSFFWSCAVAFPVVHFFPNFLVPILIPIVMTFRFPMKKIYDLIVQVAHNSYDVKETEKETTFQQESIILWITQMTKVREIAEVARISLGLLFASAFQVPMIAQFVIHRLCISPECHETLQAEAHNFSTSVFTARNQEMPYLDSFIKETARLSPGPIVSSPRTCMVNYTMPDGCHVPSGGWIAVPQISLMRDEKVWPRARSFEGFRFVDKSEAASLSRLTHPTHEFPFWGSVRHACPARFYVSVVMKMVVAHILTDYDVKLADEKASPNLNVGKARLPSPFMQLLIRRKQRGAAATTATTTAATIPTRTTPATTMMMMTASTA